MRADGHLVETLAEDVLPRLLDRVSSFRCERDARADRSGQIDRRPHLRDLAREILEDLDAAGLRIDWR